MSTKYMLLAGAVVLLLLVGVVFLLNSNKKTSPASTSAPQSQTQTEASPTPSEAETPTQVMKEENKIDLTVSGFSPKNLTIKKGAKVVWSNNSGKTATINSNPHPVHTSYTPLNLGSFNDGETLELIFDKAGTYNYHNHFNASQGGTITVEE